MKRIILAVTGLLVVACLNAQTLEEIVKKYSAANKLDKLNSLSTLKITAKTSAMGAEMPVVMWMKNPNKIKTITSFNGQEIVQVFDGEKGYMINPMTGSSDPVEMNAEMVKQTMRSNIFQNPLVSFLKNGQLTLEGEEKVNDKNAYKIKANIDAANFAYMFIDKGSFLILKTNATMSQAGQTLTIETFPSNYTETNGVFLPMKTTMSMGGMEMITTFDKIEVNVPMEDSVFKIK
jgi:outer membrane lipoprotein-sorting protein